MKKRFTSVGLCVGFLFAGGAFAGGAADQIRVGDAYVRAVPPGQPNSASFMVLNNGSANAHALVGAASPVANTVELHTHIMDQGMMKMRRVERVDLPAGESVRLQPGGLHLMLIGLKQQLNPEDQIDLTLTFEDGSAQQVKAPVRPVEVMMQHDQHQHMKH